MRRGIMSAKQMEVLFIFLLFVFLFQEIKKIFVEREGRDKGNNFDE
jgi:hypothetical protein